MANCKFPIGLYGICISNDELLASINQEYLFSEEHIDDMTDNGWSIFSEENFEGEFYPEKVGHDFSNLDYFMFYPLSQQPMLTEKAYASKEQAVAELKSKCKKYLNDGFDYLAHFGELSGIFYEV